jgi:hypothetical protein
MVRANLHRRAINRGPHFDGQCMGMGMGISISDSIISISYKLTDISTDSCLYNGNPVMHRVVQLQVSGRGPTFRITRGSFFVPAAAGVVSGVDSGDDDDDAASAADSGALAAWPA